MIHAAHPRDVVSNFCLTSSAEACRSAFSLCQPVNGIVAWGHFDYLLNRSIRSCVDVRTLGLQHQLQHAIAAVLDFPSNNFSVLINNM